MTSRLGAPATEPGLIGTDRPLSQLYDVLLVDLDGVVYIGPDAVPGAAEALRRARDAGMGARFVTNNASRPAPVVAQHLRDLGVDCGDEEVVTSAQAAAGLLADRFDPGAKILVVGGAGLYWALEQDGLAGVGSMDDEPVAIVQGFGPEVGWRLLAEGTRAVRSGLPWIATNTDLTVPTQYGPAPGNGTLVAAIATAAKATPEVAGKPEPPLFLDAVRRSGSKRPLVVGDRLDTDLEGARAANIDGLAVLTGVSTAAEIMAAVPRLRPHLIGQDLDCLMEAHPQPSRSEEAWACRGSAVTVRDGQLDVQRTGSDPLDLLRAACSASWEVMDDDAGEAPGAARVLEALARLDGSISWDR